MKPDALPDDELAGRIRRGDNLSQDIVDEYYRRCIPYYLDFIGVHWHTGLYAPSGGDISPRDQEDMIGYLAELCRMKSGDSVLDVGCGIGATLAWLAGRLDIRGAGLTPVTAQRDIAVEIAARRNLAGQLAFAVGHADDLPFPERSFDRVLFLESPCHFADRDAFFREAWRVLKPGGALCGEDWVRADGISDAAAERWLDPVARTWATPPLGGMADYRAGMAAAGFDAVASQDARDISALHRGFCTTAEAQAELKDDISRCRDPIWALTLEGLLRLGEALQAGAFTIGIFHAIKPAT